jgi:hypothetical protein
MASLQQGLPARRTIDWCFRNRETGAITVAQAPNLILWIVIATGALRWIWSSGTPGFLLTVGFKGSLAIWAVDEFFRGVNPWRRFLGAVVLIYDLATIL